MHSFLLPFGPETFHCIAISQIKSFPASTIITNLLKITSFFTPHCNSNFPPVGICHPSEVQLHIPKSRWSCWMSHNSYLKLGLAVHKCNFPLHNDTWSATTSVSKRWSVTSWLISRLSFWISLRLRLYIFYRLQPQLENKNNTKI